MQFEDLPALWQARDDAPALAPAEALEGVVKRSRDMDASVRRRDWLETGVAWLVAPVFLAVAVLGPSPLSRLGGAVIVLACIGIPLRLAWARRHAGAARRELSMAQFLVEERNRLADQESLLRTIVWWYLLPLGLGSVLVYSGFQPLAQTAAYAGTLVLVYAFIYLLNQAAVRKRIRPQLAAVEALLKAIEVDP